MMETWTQSGQVEIRVLLHKRLLLVSEEEWLQNGRTGQDLRD